MDNKSAPPWGLPTPNINNEAGPKVEPGPSSNEPSDQQPISTEKPVWGNDPPWGKKLPPKSIKNPGQNYRMLGALSYIGPLILVPLLFTALAKNHPFVRFHLKQGLILILCWTAFIIISIMLARISFLAWLDIPFSLLAIISIVILAIVGVMNSVDGYENDLPFVGKIIK